MSITDLYELARYLVKQITFTKKHKVLIVEDNPYDLQLINTYLNKLKIDYDYAGTAEEAMGRIQEKKYTVVFVDLRLPLMGGVDFSKRIKEELPETTVIIVPGLMDDVIKLPKGGLILMIGKPVTLDALKEVFKKLKIN